MKCKTTAHHGSFHFTLKGTLSKKQKNYTKKQNNANIICGKALQNYSFDIQDLLPKL